MDDRTPPVIDGWSLKLVRGTRPLDTSGTSFSNPAFESENDRRLLCTWLQSNPCRWFSSVPEIAQPRPAPLRYQQTSAQHHRVGTGYQRFGNTLKNESRHLQSRMSVLTSATFDTALTCGTPIPVTIRVVQIEPGPIPPTHRACIGQRSAASPVAILPLSHRQSGSCLLSNEPGSERSWSGMAVSPPVHQPRSHKSVYALIGVCTGTNRCTTRNCPYWSLRARGMTLIEVLDGDQP